MRTEIRVLALVAVVLLVAGCASQPSFDRDAAGIVPDFRNTQQVCVLPIIFIPSDVPLPDAEIASSKQLFLEYLAKGQALYQGLMGTTFCVENEVLAYRSPHNTAYYAADGGSKMVNEVFAVENEDRYSSGHVYLMLFARPDGYKGELFGGGRTFNGPPNTGGGFVQLEYTSLTKEYPYHFLSTVVHELGHSFGLTHVNCFGNDLNSGDSIMSYSAAHGSNGLEWTGRPSNFNPEEYYELSLNKRVFPDFNYTSAKYDPNNEMPSLDRIQSCFLGNVGEEIGNYTRFAGVGYELFFNGNLVSGAGTEMFSLKQAQDNCKWNQDNHSGISIECRYNGYTFFKP